MNNFRERECTLQAETAFDHSKMSLLFWRQTVCTRKTLAVASKRSYSGLMFGSATAFSRLIADTGASSSAKHLFQKWVMRQPCSSLQHSPKCHSWAPRNSVQWACRKCQQNSTRQGLTAFVCRRNFAVSSRLKQKAKDEVAKNPLKTKSKTVTIPKTSEVKRLLSQSRPEKWRILGGNL